MSYKSDEEIINKILIRRGLKTVQARKDYLNPTYEKLGYSGLLPDIKKAVKRILEAKEKKQKVCVYGDYDVDGLTATTLLMEALTKMGIECMSYIPDRFVDGYGMSSRGVVQIAKAGAGLIITVDCGSRSHKEIDEAIGLGVDVIVTDHHSLGVTLPNCTAVINPKRKDSKYPFSDLSGVGVAFNLVRELQKATQGMDEGQEKWLLDLVALGTTCDIVSMTGDNRVLTKWGLEVARKSRRPAFDALCSVSTTEKAHLRTDDFGYRFGPRLNAAGRLENANLSLKLLQASDYSEARTIANELDALNNARRNEQKRIVQAVKRDKHDKERVIVVADESWAQGVVGIVATKTVEHFGKPAFVMQIIGDITKGSARSFGDFNLAKALDFVSEHIISGGGHAFAAGVTLETSKINEFRKAINDYYDSLKLENQERFMEQNIDTELDDFQYITSKFIEKLALLEPFGKDNERPVFSCIASVVDARPVGSDSTHLKMKLVDKSGVEIEAIGFGIADNYDFDAKKVKAIFNLSINEFRGDVAPQLELRYVTKV